MVRNGKAGVIFVTHGVVYFAMAEVSKARGTSSEIIISAAEEVIEVRDDAAGYGEVALKEGLAERHKTQCLAPSGAGVLS